MDDIFATMFPDAPKLVKPTACPRCGASPVCSIAYGLPARGTEFPPDVVWGGCTIREELWFCKSCRHSWGAEESRAHAERMRQYHAERRRRREAEKAEE
jgi:hypothetical protein